MSDFELPGMWESADFEGGLDEVREAAKVTVSWSEISDGRQCFFKHELGYGQRWQTTPQPDSSLGKGTLWHTLLEGHYKTIQAYQTGEGPGRWSIAREELLRECRTVVAGILNSLDLPEDIIELMVFMYKGHLEAYGLDEDWEIIAVEHTAIVPLGPGFNLKAKIDLIVKDRCGKIIIIDHKSCSALPSNKDLDFNDQFGLYVFALRKLGMNVYQAIHSAAKTKMNQGDKLKEGDPGYKKSMKPQALSDRFLRTPLNKTDAELAGIEADAYAMAKLLYSEANPKVRVTNEDTCKWKCSFTEACYLGRRTGSNAELIHMLRALGFEQNFTRH